MQQATFNKVVGSIFAVVTLAHLWRILTNTKVIFGSLEIPFWVSVVGILLAGYLAYSAYRLVK